jgi:hypothetical protein
VDGELSRATVRNITEEAGDYFDRRNGTAARQRYLTRELERLGNRVTLEPAA